MCRATTEDGLNESENSPAPQSHRPNFKWHSPVFESLLEFIENTVDSIVSCQALYDQYYKMTVASLARVLASGAGAYAAFTGASISGLSVAGGPATAGVLATWGAFNFYNMWRYRNRSLKYQKRLYPPQKTHVQGN